MDRRRGVNFRPAATRAPALERSHLQLAWPALISHEVVANLIGATTNKKGLKVRAHLDTGYYPTGVKMTNKELAAVPLTKHGFHGDWNYTVHHAPPSGASTTTA